MKFTIVTISFNQAKYIRECIESVLSQDIDCLEYIVVDPGSTDGSRDIIDSYGSVIKLYESDTGPADGLNKGFKLASGEYFGFVNADDYLLPGALRKVNLAIKESGAHFISGNGIRDSLDEKLVVMPTVLTLDKLLSRSSVLFQQSTFFSRDLFNKVGGFNNENRTCWDYELYVDLLANGAKHRVLRQNLAGFRVYPNSITGSGRLKDLYLSDLNRIFKKYKGRDYNFFDSIVRYMQKVFECQV